MTPGERSGMVGVDVATAQPTRLSNGGGCEASPDIDESRAGAVPPAGAMSRPMQPDVENGKPRIRRTLKPSDELLAVARHTRPPLNVPKNVPATAWNRPKPIPLQPTTQKKMRPQRLGKLP